MEDPAKRSAEDSTGGSPDGSRQETDYRRIVDSVPGYVLVADAKGQIVYANMWARDSSLGQCDSSDHEELNKLHIPCSSKRPVWMN
jgi:hypothetical protein